MSGPSVQGVTGSVLHVCDTKLYVSQIINIYQIRFTVFLLKSVNILVNNLSWLKIYEKNLIETTAFEI